MGSRSVCINVGAGLGEQCVDRTLARDMLHPRLVNKRTHGNNVVTCSFSAGLLCRRVDIVFWFSWAAFPRERLYERWTIAGESPWLLDGEPLIAVAG